MNPHVSIWEILATGIVRSLPHEAFDELMRVTITHSPWWFGGLPQRYVPPGPHYPRWENRELRITHLNRRENEEHVLIVVSRWFADRKYEEHLQILLNSNQPLKEAVLEQIDSIINP